MTALNNFKRIIELTRCVDTATREAFEEAISDRHQVEAIIQLTAPDMAELARDLEAMSESVRREWIEDVATTQDAPGQPIGLHMARAWG